MTKASAPHVPPLPSKLARAKPETLFARLGVLADEIEAHRADEKKLLAERLAIFGALVERGVTHVELGRHAKVTKMAVAAALRDPADRPKRGKPKP